MDEGTQMNHCKRALLAAAVLGAATLTVAGAQAAEFTFEQTTPYLSAANIPVGFYDANGPVLLDNLEDGSLDASLSASAGSIIGPGQFDGLRDSVDGDDGAIDGSGLGGRSWFFGNGTTGVRFTFTGGNLPTAFGLVLTDGSSSSITFSAEDGNGVSLGTFVASGFLDGNFAGGTAEDRFFGITHADGIKSILIQSPGGGIEIDHIQYGAMSAVPLPAAGWLLFPAAGWLLRRKRAA